MGEKKEIKVSLTTVILLFVVFILIVALGGMYFYYNYILNPKETKNDIVASNNLTENENNTIPVGKIDENKDLVYTAFADYSSEHSYSVPKININSQYVLTINNEIENEIIKLVKNDDTNYGNISYESSLNENILSVVIEIEHKYMPMIYYKVYNVEINTGERMNNEELINVKKFTKTEFLNKLQSALENDFKETFKSEQMNEFYEENYNKTISKENYSIDNQMFLDKNGNICVIAKVYTFAGAGEAWTIVTIR